MQKIDKELKDQINKWFEGDRNYKIGLSLLKEAGFNQKGLLKTLDKGENKDNKTHLCHQLFKISDHTDPKIKSANSKIDKSKTPKKDNKPKKEVVIKGVKGKTKIDPVPGTKIGGFLPDINISEVHPEVDLSFEDGTPEAILLAKIIERQKVFYNLRSMSHTEMTKLGDDNTESIIAKRKEYLDIIKHSTLIVDFLHDKKIEWKVSGIMPDVSILEWVPELEAEEKKEIKNVDEIPAIDLQSELAKVRSRLSKYTKKMKDLSGKKLDAMKAKQTEDLKLKDDLTKQINDLRAQQ